MTQRAFMGTRWFIHLLIFFAVVLSASSGLASSDQETPQQEQKAEQNEATKAPPELKRVRVLTEDAGEVVTKGMNFVRSTGEISWWSADVFGREGYVRIVACQGEEKKPECFEIRLKDPAGGCSGANVGNWCIEFPSGAADEWVSTKLLIHPHVTESNLKQVWRRAGLESDYTKEIILGAFRGTSEAYAIAATPGIVEQGSEFEDSAEFHFYLTGADTPAEVQILVQAFLALLLFGFLLRGLDPTKWKTLAAWIGLFGVGLGLRMTFGFGGLFHENHHGFNYLAAILNGHGQTFGIPSSYITLLHPAAHLLGGTDQAVFLANGIFSALCIPLLGILTRELTGRAWAGWVAAILWTITPHPVRLATTEIYFNFSAFILLAASLASLKAFRALNEEGRSGKELFALLGLSALLITLSAQVRVLTLLYPLAIAALVWAGGGLQTRRQWVLFGVLSAVIASLCIPQGFAILDAVEAQPERSSGLVSAACLVTNGQDFIFFDPTVVSPFLLLFAAFGALATFLRSGSYGNLRGWGIVGSVLWVVVLAGFVCGVEVSRIRFEVPAHAMLTILAAIGLVALQEALKDKMKVMSYAIVLIGVGALQSPLAFLDRNFQDPMEYEFIQDAVLPPMNTAKSDGQVILVQPDHIANEFGTIGAGWWERQLSGIVVVNKLEGVQNFEETRPRIFTYIGLDCFWASPGFEDIPYPKAAHVQGLRIHPVCAASLVGAEWQPVVELDVTRQDTVGSCVDIQEDRVAVGLYEGRRP